MRIIIKHHVGQRGFTLLLAALVSSIVLAIGVSLSELAQKSIVLSSLGRDSQVAFAAADSGLECALYWDMRKNLFQIGVAPTLDPAPSCDGQNISVSVTNGDRSTYPYTLSFQFAPTSNGVSYCARVSITKTTNMSTGGITSVVHSDGFSTDCDSISTSQRALQRSIELRY